MFGPSCILHGGKLICLPISEHVCYNYLMLEMKEKLKNHFKVKIIIQCIDIFFFQIKSGDDASFNKIMEVKGHKSIVTTVDWSPNIDTQMCLTGAMDGKIRVTTLLSDK